MTQQTAATRTVNEDLTYGRFFMDGFNVDGLDAPDIIPTGGSCAQIFTPDGFCQYCDGFIARDI